MQPKHRLRAKSHAQEESGIGTNATCGPEMDAFAVVAAMQKEARWRNIPVIVITARDLNAKDRERLNSGVHSVLLKNTFRPDELVERIRELIHGQVRREQLKGSDDMTKVLYVEDNDENVYMLKMRLELLGDFEVLTAEDGEKGCEKAVSKQPDIVLNERRNACHGQAGKPRGG